ncbi:uncharacterized protein CEXT_639281 [Caerostris extrusa]|uniref:Uncharacterized protein n=1 Tax=Caerostris extrusa TaxID=172846 RepID=A0AAV4MEI5_CAEEX|nr:uncharacterized protein CEXT_639281 [Caerostris extrusa]
MAVTKQKGSGVETPTSEPGYSITDYDWEDMEGCIVMKAYFMLSICWIVPIYKDECQILVRNLNTWCQKLEKSSRYKKSQSETEVDYYSNGINEIEAGDIRDDLIEQINSEENAEKLSKFLILLRNLIGVKLKKSANKILHCSGKKKYPDRNSNEDLSKIDDNAKELDDPTYNKLWTLHGFGQAYHFWKESRRASSPALNAYLTYVTLPWHSIIAGT